MPDARTAFVRLLLFVCCALGPTTLAHAFTPEGATAELIVLDGRGGLSLGLMGLDTTASTSLADESYRIRIAALALRWSEGGFTLSVAAGQRFTSDFALSGLGSGTSPFTAVDLSQELMQVAAGALVAEFSARRVLLDDVPNLAVGLRWSRRF